MYIGGIHLTICIFLGGVHFRSVTEWDSAFVIPKRMSRTGRGFSANSRKAEIKWGKALICKQEYDGCSLLGLLICKMSPWLSLDFLPFRMIDPFLTSILPLHMARLKDPLPNRATFYRKSNKNQKDACMFC